MMRNIVKKNTRIFNVYFHENSHRVERVVQQLHEARNLLIFFSDASPEGVALLFVESRAILEELKAMKVNR